MNKRILTFGFLVLAAGMVTFQSCTKEQEEQLIQEQSETTQTNQNSGDKNTATVTAEELEYTYYSQEQLEESEATLYELEEGQALEAIYDPETEQLGVAVQNDPPTPNPARVRCLENSQTAALLCAFAIAANNPGSNYCFGFTISQNSMGTWVTEDDCP